MHPHHGGYQSWGRIIYEQSNKATPWRRGLRPASYVVWYAHIAVSSKYKKEGKQEKRKKNKFEKQRAHTGQLQPGRLYLISVVGVVRFNAHVPTAAIWDIVSVVSHRWPLFEESMRQKADLCEIAGAPLPRSTSTAW